LAISKQRKQESVAELKEMLSRSKAVILSDYRGLTAAQMASVRNRLRPLDSKFLVAKNTLLARSLEEVGLPASEELLQGPTAISFCFADFREPVRAILDVAKETDILSVKGGLLGSYILNAEAVRSLPTLPSPDALRAQALGGLQAPVSGFVGVLDSALRSLVYVFGARAEQMGEPA
jgi:large subunit ribosomal protein L10